MRQKLTVQDVEDIAVGGAVLGTGGGGDPYVGKLMAQRSIEQYGSPEMIPLKDIPDSKLIMVAAGIGTPTVIVEKIPRGDEAVHVFKALEKYMGKKAYAVMSAEVGGLNGTIPIQVAARLKIPVVDADCMGRAFPEVQLVIPNLYGVPATPLIIADEKGNEAVLNTINNEWTERFTRSMSVQMGGIALMALYTMTAKTAKKATLHGMMSYCASIGRTLRTARRRKQDILAALLKITRGVRLFKGKIVDLDRRAEKGWNKGVVTIQGSDDFGGQSMKIDIQNENLIARIGDRVVATVPDLITVLDQDTSYPITVEALKYGLRVTVIGIACHREWRKPEGIALAGPHHFGYDFPYQPLQAGGARKRHVASARN
jgi:uncharacterized protein